ncbi:MAG: hypothetical protein AB1416_11250, partial [Actinomycetota bacterium]
MSRARSLPVPVTAALAMIALALAALVGAGRAGAAPAAPPVSIASGSINKIVGEGVTLTAKTRSLPPDAQIVIIGTRANGTTFVVKVCAKGVLVCTRRVRVSTGTGARITFRAFVRRGGKILRRSRAV